MSSTGEYLNSDISPSIKPDSKMVRIVHRTAAVGLSSEASTTSFSTPFSMDFMMLYTGDSTSTVLHHDILSGHPQDKNSSSPARASRRHSAASPTFLLKTFSYLHALYNMKVALALTIFAVTALSAPAPDLLDTGIQALRLDDWCQSSKTQLAEEPGSAHKFVYDLVHLTIPFYDDHFNEVTFAGT